jgi:hypothetical protein
MQSSIGYTEEKKSRNREYGLVFNAYKAGATDLRDTKIYISPKK